MTDAISFESTVIFCKNFLLFVYSNTHSLSLKKIKRRIFNNIFLIGCIRA